MNHRKRAEKILSKKKIKRSDKVMLFENIISEQFNLTALRYHGGAFGDVNAEDIGFAEEFFTDSAFHFAISMMHLILCASPREDRASITSDFLSRIKDLEGARISLGRTLIDVLVFDLISQMESLIHNCPESIKESHVRNSKERAGLELKSVEDMGYLDTVDALLGVHWGVGAGWRWHWYDQVEISSDPRYDNLPYWRKKQIHKEWEKNMEDWGPIVMIVGPAILFFIIYAITCAI